MYLTELNIKPSTTRTIHTTKAKSKSAYNFHF